MLYRPLSEFERLQNEIEVLRRQNKQFKQYGIRKMEEVAQLRERIIELESKLSIYRKRGVM